MNRNRFILLIFLLGLLAVVAWLVVPARLFEPSYDGQPLSYWLAAIDRANHAYPPPWTATIQNDVDTATNAVSHIGARAIPELLGMIRAHHSAWQFKLQKFASNNLSMQIKLADTDDKNYSAAAGFVVIGTNARPAIPALIEILQHRYSPMSLKCTCIVLGSFGPDAAAAVPALLRILTNSPGNSFAAVNARSDAIDILGRIHSRPELAVPVLTHLLGGRESLAAVAQALGAYGPEAESAIPLLLNLTTDFDKWVRLSAIEAIRNIDPAEAARHQTQFDALLNSPYNP